MKKEVSIIYKKLREVGFKDKDLDVKNPYWIKINPATSLRNTENKRKSFFIAVSGINPTSLGEGKSFISIGLSSAFNYLKKRAISCLRYPSLGLSFGRKGAGLGAGKIKVKFEDKIIYDWNEDSLKISLVNNLISSLSDNISYFYKDKLSQTEFKRCWLIPDRVLRKINTPYGERRFYLVQNSEIMSILALSKSEEDLKRRLNNVLIGLDSKSNPVYLKELRITDILYSLLKESFKPNVFSTSRGGLFILHTGCFANNSLGSSSVIADLLSTRYFDYVITECGFGTELGLEKMIHIKGHYSKLYPQLVILVCSVRAVKYHSGKFGMPPSISSEIYKKDLSSLEEGSVNLLKHIENIKAFGLKCIVVINRFDSDSWEEINLLKKISQSKADAVFVSESYQKGEKSLIELVHLIEHFKSKCKSAHSLFSSTQPLKLKVEKISKILYGAEEITFEEKALKKLELLKRWNKDKLPVCMCKTQYSLSTDSKKLGLPQGWNLTIKDLVLFSGAGYILVLTPKTIFLPGLPPDTKVYRIPK